MFYYIHPLGYSLTNILLMHLPFPETTVLYHVSYQLPARKAASTHCHGGSFNLTAWQIQVTAARCQAESAET
jgi:hypothetical protein